MRGSRGAQRLLPPGADRGRIAPLVASVAWLGCGPGRRASGRVGRDVLPPRHRLLRQAPVPLIEAQGGSANTNWPSRMGPKPPGAAACSWSSPATPPRRGREVRHSASGQITAVRHRPQWPSVKHDDFHLLDPAWGQGPIRMCGEGLSVVVSASLLMLCLRYTTGLVSPRRKPVDYKLDYSGVTSRRSTFRNA